MQDALFVTDPAGQVIYMNPAAKTLYGFEDRIDTDGSTINLRRHSDETFSFRTHAGVPVDDEDRPVVRALRGERYRDVELMVQRTGDADPRVYVFSGHRIEGDPPLSVLTVRDETDRWRSERRYMVAFEADPAPAVIARLDDLRIVEANQGMAALTGFDVSDLDAEQREHQQTQDELDTTRREYADEKAVLDYQAIFDPLTRIPNRRGLDVRLADEVQRAERYGNVFSLLMLDLDHFKKLNDTLGHDAGDDALLQVARVLQDAARGSDFVGRWGGEEFLIILPESGPTAALESAARIRERIEREAFVGVGNLTVSIGVATFEASDSADRLFKRADRALYAAKERGRNRVEVAPRGSADA